MPKPKKLVPLLALLIIPIALIVGTTSYQTLQSVLRTKPHELLSAGLVFKTLKDGLEYYWIVDDKGENVQQFNAEEYYFNENQYSLDIETEIEYLKTVQEQTGYTQVESAYLGTNPDQILVYIYPEGKPSSPGEIRKLEIWKMTVPGESIRRVFVTQTGYNQCNQVIGWDQNRREIYTEILLPNGENLFTKGFCIYEEDSGLLIETLNLPNYESKNYSGPFYDRSSNHILVYDNKPQASRADFISLPSRTIQPIKVADWSQYQILRNSFFDGKILFINNRELAAYNLTTNQVSKTFTIEAKDPSHSSVLSLAGLAPDHSKALFKDTINDNRDCYHVYNLKNYSTFGYFCDDVFPETTEAFVGWKN